ncbi:PucR family transcriptional regulator [Cumulibacter manganitolerans]|uniref:PucR family transcriptional regulator n=1 Tax=Cumulibacter manganitolerans TaxID=1884992 RepID=UPI001296D086|nr:helix-turn-helix domain-containing protein [Cumulibacter manganitolerans]
MPLPSDDVQRLYEAILGDVEGLTRRILDAIRTEIPPYQEFPYDIHYADNVVNLTMQLRSLASGDEPSPEAAEHARAMARTRVGMDLPLAQAIAGYHVGFRELWKEVVQRAGEDAALQSQLPLEVERIWGWFHLVSSAYAEEFVLTSRTRALSRADALRRLVAGTGEDLSVAQLETTAAELGFDLGTPFRSFVTAQHPREVLDRLDIGFSDHADATSAVSVGGHCVVVTQQCSVPAGVARLRAAGVRGCIAVGLSRRGVTGIRDSYVDGLRLLELPDDGSDVREFESEWPLTLLNSERERMRELLEPGVVVAAENPHLAQVVVAFAENEYSISATARALHIHPNTARYRITRWEELTGWNLFTVRGLLSSVAALQNGRSGLAPGGPDRARP